MEALGVITAQFELEHCLKNITFEAYRWPVKEAGASDGVWCLITWGAVSTTPSLCEPRLRERGWIDEVDETPHSLPRGPRLR